MDNIYDENSNTATVHPVQVMICTSLPLFQNVNSTGFFHFFSQLTRTPTHPHNHTHTTTTHTHQPHHTPPTHHTHTHLNVLLSTLEQCKGRQFIWQRNVLPEYFKTVSQLSTPKRKGEEGNETEKAFSKTLLNTSEQPFKSKPWVRQWLNRATSALARE